MRTLHTLLVLLALGAPPTLLAACDKTLPGDRCLTLEDCDPPLVCSNRDLPEGSRGVCVPPEALPDAAVTQDASP
jgi:hypothetical protein